MLSTSEQRFPGNGRGRQLTNVDDTSRSIRSKSKVEGKKVYFTRKSPRRFYTQAEREYPDHPRLALKSWWNGDNQVSVRDATLQTTEGEAHHVWWGVEAGMKPALSRSCLIRARTSIVALQT